jgi:hypothetical protein
MTRRLEPSKRVQYVHTSGLWGGGGGGTRAKRVASASVASIVCAVKTQTLTVRLNAHDYAAMLAHSRALGVPKGAAGGRMLSHALRSLAHPAIELEFAGALPVARLRGRRVSVWSVMSDVEGCGGDVRRAAKQLGLPLALVQAAQRYASTFPEEMEQDAKLGRRTLEECGLEETPLPEKDAA